MSSKNQLGGMVYFVYNEELKNNGRNPVLMIHGHGGDHQGLEEIAKQLNTIVIIPDLPGFGESKEITEHTIEAYTEDLNTLMNDLGLERYDIIGHSFGAALALLLATKYKKARRLLLINPAPQISFYLKNLLLTLYKAIEKLPEEYKHRLVHADWYNTAGFLIASGSRYSQQKMKIYVANQKKINYSFRAWAECMESIYSFDQIALAKKCNVPVVMMHGDRDMLVSAKSTILLHKEFSDAELVRVPEAGHFIPIENADKAVEQALRLFDASVFFCR